MNKYSIAIPNEKAATYKVITFIMLLMNMLVFGFIFFNSLPGNHKNLSLLGLLLNAIAITIFCLFNYSKTKNLKNYRVEIAFIISALLWLFIGNYLLALLLLAFAVMAVYTNKKLIIYFSPDGIRYPSFPSTLFLWPAVEQVILKDDILTIDMKDNKLLQFAIDRQHTATVDEKEFNDFCKGQLVLT